MDSRYLLLSLLLLSTSLHSDAARDLQLPSGPSHLPLAQVLDISPSSLISEYSARRKAIGFNINDLFTFCWKDTHPRKRISGTTLTGGCRLFKDGSLYYCYEPCEAPRYKPAGAVSELGSKGLCSCPAWLVAHEMADASKQPAPNTTTLKILVANLAAFTLSITILAVNALTIVVLFFTSLPEAEPPLNIYSPFPLP